MTSPFRYCLTLGSGRRSGSPITAPSVSPPPNMDRPASLTPLKDWCTTTLVMGFRRRMTMRPGIGGAERPEEPVSTPQAKYAVATAFCNDVVNKAMHTVTAAPSVTVEHAAFICANVRHFTFCQSL